MYQTIVDLLNTYLFRGASASYEWGSFVCQVGGGILTALVLFLPFYLVIRLATRWL